MSRKDGAGVGGYLHGLIVALALLLPTVSLTLLGGIWLWQNGYLLHWALAACALSVAAYGLQLWLLRKSPLTDAAVTGAAQAEPSAAADAALDDEGAAPDANWTGRERKAWSAVLGIAAKADPATLKDRQAFIDLGQRTVEAVARTLHPDEKDPMLRFTVPEALALVERVAGRLRPFVADTIPLGDTVTVGQAMRFYNWRSAIGWVERGYDAWRLLRFLNPLTAATHEMREQISKRLFAWGKDVFARKLAVRYVEEIGRAAIELYGGRLKISPERLAGHVTDASQKNLAEAEKRPAEPIRILIAGQTGAGKSSLINALCQEVRAAADVLPQGKSFAPYVLKRDGIPGALLIDSPGVNDKAKDREQLIAEAANCDLVIWVAGAARADRELDRQSLDAIRKRFAADLARPTPPLLLVLSHADKLRPFGEWSPPYDITAAVDGKAANIRAAMEAASEDLGFAIEDIVPVCLDRTAGLYNIDALWAEIHEVLPDAQSAQLARILGDAGSFSWGRLWQQTVNAGRIIARNVKN